jgi:polar amino acid transport system substrate-binding protein
MKKVFIIMITVALAFALSACGGGTGDGEEADAAEDAATEEQSEGEPADEDDFAYMQDKGSIVIGITDYEPMNYYDESGKLVGFDTEFAEAVCAELGLTPEFVIINWETKETELKAKSIDCLWNGVTVDDERRQNMAFSTSYMRNEQSVVVRADDAGKYADAASLAGASVVAEQGSAGETAVSADIADAAYTAVSSQASALLEVKAGTADAAVIDYTMARTMTGADTDYADLTIVEGIELTDEEYAIGFRLGSTAVDRVNEVIAAFESDGTLAGIAEKYGVTDLLIQ